MFRLQEQEFRELQKGLNDKIAEANNPN